MQETTTVQFNRPRPTKTVELPSFPGSQVEVYTGLLVSETRILRVKFPNLGKTGHEDEMNANIAGVIYAIKKWNFIDEAGNPIPVSQEYIDQISTNDLNTITRVFAQNLSKEEKKTEQ